MEKHGVEVVAEAEDVYDGINSFKKTKPDIVTLDISMNRHNGMDCLKSIISINPNAIVYVLSKMEQKWMKSEAMLSGAKGFIIKPFTEESFVGILPLI